MQTINFTTKLFTIGTLDIIKLPADASAKLPSRGQTMVKGTINGHQFQTVLEPDGKLSHWFAADQTLRQDVGMKPGDSVTLAVEATKDWPEPEVPADINSGLANHQQTKALWQDITPMARWDWIRWIRSTNNPETRQRRIEVARSKLLAGSRRPCCFNRNICTVPDVSKNGVLLDSSSKS